MIKYTYSVLISVYKGEKDSFLYSSLESIHLQTFLPECIILIKDGPLTKALEEVIEKFINLKQIEYEIITLEKSYGLGYCLKIGVEKTLTDYVIRMDSDDISAYNRIELLNTYINAFPHLSLIGSYVEEFISTPGDMNRIKKVPLSIHDIKRFSKYRNPFNHMSVAFKRVSVLDVHNYENFFLLEDYYLWYKLLQNGHLAINIPEITVYARIGNGMHIKRRGWKYLKSEVRLFKIMYQNRWINFLQFTINILIRFFVRLQYPSVVKSIYRFIRKFT